MDIKIDITYETRQQLSETPPDGKDSQQVLVRTWNEICEGCIELCGQTRCALLLTKKNSRVHWHIACVIIMNVNVDLRRIEKTDLQRQHQSRQIRRQVQQS